MRKKMIIPFLTIVSMILCSCIGGKGTGTSTSVDVSSGDSQISASGDDIIVPTSIIDAIGDDNVEEDDGIDHITKAEKKVLESFIKEKYNYAFLLSTYEDVRNASLDEIFYNGDVDYKETSADRRDYKRLSGETEIHSSLSVISVEKMNAILTEKTGYALDEFNTQFSKGYYEPDGKRYFFIQGDTNYFEYTIVDGYHEEDKVVLFLHPSEKNDYYANTGYHSSYRQLVLKKDGNDYKFVSCKDLYEVGAIESFCYNVTMPYFGKCKLMAYQPTQGNFDVTFKLVKGNEIISVFGGDYEKNNLIDKTFDSIVDLNIDDYNFDGYTDMVVLCQYIEEDNTESFEFKVYEGNEFGYLIYMPALSADVNEKIVPITSVAATGHIRSQALGDDSWKKAYIEEINTYDTEYIGFQLAHIDADMIPELICEGDCEATGAKITSFSNGNASTLILNRLYFSYIYPDGLINNSDGVAGDYFDNIYYLSNGVFNAVASGHYYEDMSASASAEGFYPLVYEWNGKTVTEAKYRECLDAVYDSADAQRGYDWQNMLTKEEMLSLLNVEYSKVY